MQVSNTFEQAFAAFTPGCLTDIISIDQSLSSEKASVVANKHATEQPITYVSPHTITTPEVFYSPEFDTSKFTFSFYAPAVRMPASQCKEFMRVARKHGCLLEVDKIRTIVSDVPVTFYPTKHALEHGVGTRASYKRLILSFPLSTNVFPSTPITSSSTLYEIPLEKLPFAELRDLITQFSQEGAALVLHRVEVGYEFFTVEQALRYLLPRGVTVPSSFATVGHIAQINLRDEQLPFKKLIGRVMLDKNPALKTVVNKLGNINNVYRNFAAEVLAGIPSLVTRLKEHNATFEFDFGEVYWNSRLQTEHGRIVQFSLDVSQMRNHSNLTSTMTSATQITSGNRGIQNLEIKRAKKNTNTTSSSKATILDLFAGVGPFAIPAGQFNCTVFANDLNPRSSLYMRRNALFNKVDRNVRVYNLDARVMMRAIARVQFEQALLQRAEESGVSVTPAMKGKSRTNGEIVPWFEHIVMNLPATAQEFCDVFNGVYAASSLSDLAALPSLPGPFKENDSTNATLTLTEDELRVLTDVPFPSFNDIESTKGFVYPIVHCYCFARNPRDLEGNAIQMCEEFLGYRLSRDDSVTQNSESIFYRNVMMSASMEGKTSSSNTAASLAPGYSSKLVLDAIEKHGVYVYNVRDVAPNKEMMCVSFQLRKDIVLGLDSPAKGKYTFVYEDYLKQKEGKEEGKEALSQVVKRVKLDE